VLEEQRPLSELAARALTRVPQVLENAKLARRVPVDSLAEASKLIRATETELGERGRVLVRWSGTEPKLRVMLEGEDEAWIRERAQAIVEAARRDLGEESPA